MKFYIVGMVGSGKSTLAGPTWSATVPPRFSFGQCDA
jgi:adenylate kinase family enzyme